MQNTCILAIVLRVLRACIINNNIHASIAPQFTNKKSIFLNELSM